jgi:hypothetical protein
MKLVRREHILVGRIFDYIDYNRNTDGSLTFAIKLKSISSSGLYIGSVVETNNKISKPIGEFSKNWAVERFILRKNK